MNKINNDEKLPVINKEDIYTDDIKIHLVNMLWIILPLVLVVIILLYLFRDYLFV